MKRLLILGAGTAGTMAANKMRPLLPPRRVEHHHRRAARYALLPARIPVHPVRHLPPPKRSACRPSGLHPVRGSGQRHDRQGRAGRANKVLLEDGTELPYDHLIIATGASPNPDETPGMADDMGGDVHEFYILDGATKLAEKPLAPGRAASSSCTSPRCRDQCPVAPLEFTFLAEALHRAGPAQGGVDIRTTPLEGGPPKPVASKYLGDILDKRNIARRTS